MTFMTKLQLICSLCKHRKSETQNTEKPSIFEPYDILWRNCKNCTVSDHVILSVSSVTEEKDWLG